MRVAKVSTHQKKNENMPIRQITMKKDTKSPSVEESKLSGNLDTWQDLTYAQTSIIKLSESESH